MLHTGLQIDWHSCLPYVVAMHTMNDEAKGIARVRRIRHHVVNPETDSDPERSMSAAELIEVGRSYLG